MMMMSVRVRASIPYNFNPWLALEESSQTSIDGTTGGVLSQDKMVSEGDIPLEKRSNHRVLEET